MLVNGARDVIAQFRGHGSAQGLELFLEDLGPPKRRIRFGHVKAGVYTAELDCYYAPTRR